jgi:hypothetical protein
MALEGLRIPAIRALERLATNFQSRLHGGILLNLLIAVAKTVERETKTKMLWGSNMDTLRNLC